MNFSNPYRKPFFISSAVFLVLLLLVFLIETSPLSKSFRSLPDVIAFGLGFGLEGFLAISFLTVISTACMGIIHYYQNHKNSSATLDPHITNSQPNPLSSVTGSTSPESTSIRNIFFSYGGNLGKKKYWLGLVVVYFIALVIGTLIVEQLLGLMRSDYDLFSSAIHHSIITPIFLVFATPVIAKRMRDTGLSPYLMIPSLLLGFFLSISWVLLFILGVLPRKNRASL